MGEREERERERERKGERREGGERGGREGDGGRGRGEKREKRERRRRGEEVFVGRGGRGGGEEGADQKTRGREMDGDRSKEETKKVRTLPICLSCRRKESGIEQLIHRRRFLIVQMMMFSFSKLDIKFYISVWTSFQCGPQDVEMFSA